MSKASKQRACPALGRDISSADCGEQRESRLACPAHCPYNPFGPANYSQLLEIETRLDAKTMERHAALAPDREALASDIARASRQGLHATQAFFAWNLFFAIGADQNTFARRWELSGWSELRNDERVLFRGKMQMRMALLEIRRVLANGQVEAVDLLSPHPAPMIFQDRNLAGIASRFSVFLTWVYPLPHFWRLSGTATTIPDMAQFTAPEIVREIVRHLGGPSSEAELRRWLAEHFPRFDAALQATAQLRRQQMLTGMDAQWGRATYELRAPFATCRDRLDGLADVVPDDLTPEEQNEGLVEARGWVDSQPKPRQLTAPGGQIMLGRVLLGRSLWRLETLGAKKLARLRWQFEQRLGERVRFTSERVDDLGGRMARQEPTVDPGLVPPRLLENPDQFLLSTSRIPALAPGVSPEDAQEELMHAAEKAFLTEPIPALDNCTPREAARDLILRPKLIQLMKQRVRSQDERNLKTGRSDDINWLLHELGLTEIIFDAPPRRPPPPQFMEDQAEEAWLESAGFDEPVAVDPQRPPAPLLPAAPLSLDEAVERLEKALTIFKTVRAAEAELSASGSTLIEDTDELTLDSLTEIDFSFAITFLLQAWFALVPPGCRAPEINFDRLEKVFASNRRQMEIATQAATPKKMEAFLKSGSQPGLLMVLMGEFLEAANTAPGQFRPSLEAQPVILALLKSVVDELDAVLRP